MESLVKETEGQVPCPNWDEEPVPLSQGINLRFFSYYILEVKKWRELLTEVQMLI